MKEDEAIYSKKEYHTCKLNKLDSVNSYSMCGCDRCVTKTETKFLQRGIPPTEETPLLSVSLTTRHHGLHSHLWFRFCKSHFCPTCHIKLETLSARPNETGLDHLCCI